MNEFSPSTLLTELQAAVCLSLKANTLRRWRVIGKGPPYLKLGGAVRYRPDDIDVFISNSSRNLQTTEPNHD